VPSSSFSLNHSEKSQEKSNIQNKYFHTDVIPFAQDEMVWTFINGIDPDLAGFAEKYLHNLFERYPDSIELSDANIDEESLSSLQSKLKEDGAQLLDEFQQAMTQYLRQKNSDPVIGMVDVLPKDELAAMAESLVNLTVFKRRVTQSIETVGGPIDVAVISKGDGFIWVKRKHYFKPELNQQFFSNYYYNERATEEK
jgi:hypothetical protein